MENPLLLDRMDDRSYVDAIQLLKTRVDLRMVVIILKSKIGTTYNVVKRLLTCERDNIGIPSQCIVNNQKNFEQGRAISVAQKIAVQVRFQLK